MFNRIIRYYNQNRAGVIGTIVVVLAIIGLIQLLNNFAKQDQEKALNAVGTNTISINQSTSTKSSNTLHTESQITDGKISSTQAKSNQDIIDNFIKVCNNKDVSTAYNYLSSDCKNELFPTLTEFKTKYVDKIFNTEKQYNIENWKTATGLYTYRVTYTENALSTGSISGSIEDYITIVTENNENKLNIFRYITNVPINKTGSNNVASIQVIDKDVYDDYEIYNVKVTNNSDNKIMTNRVDDNDGIYVQYGSGNAKYTAFISEIIQSNLSLEKGQAKYLSIKINKLYTGDLNAKKIVFSDIINNKAAFEQMTNKSNYNDISTIEINL